MDLEAIKVLLDSQERAFRSAMDLVVDQFKTRVREAEGTIKDLTRSLEFSQAEIKDLQSEVKMLKKSDNENKATNEALQLKNKELDQRQNYQEDYNRRCNLRITGIEEKPAETWEETANAVSQLLETKLQMPAVRLERAHRTGLVTPPHSRTIVARFEKFSDREAVMCNARTLKGTRIYINEDLCPASQEIKKNQMPLLKKAREEGKIAFFKHTKLIIKNKNNDRVALGDDVEEGGQSSRSESNAAVCGGSPCGSLVGAGGGHDVQPGLPGITHGAAGGGSSTAGRSGCDGRSGSTRVTRGGGPSALVDEPSQRPRNRKK